MHRYRSGEADKFIFFVIGNAERHFMGRLGDPSNSFRNDIQYLKGCRLLNQIGDTPIDNEFILQAISELNAEAAGHL